MGSKDNDTKSETVTKFWNFDLPLSKSKQNTGSNFFEQTLTEKMNSHRSQDTSFNRLNEESRNLNAVNSPTNIFEREKYGDSFSKRFGDRKSFKILRDELKSKSLADQIPLSKIYEIQDLMNDVSKDEFNDLPSK